MPPTHAGADRSCPDWQTLLDFHVGRLSPAAREGVETHVRWCTECESVLVELAEEPGAEGDSLPDRLIAYLRGEPTPDPDEAGYRAMMAAARAARVTATADGGNETATFPPGEGANTPAELRIGPYEILGLIGQGGMGVVYKARHSVIRHVVALKQVRAGANHRPDILARFRTEAVAIGRLGHPHVVRIYDFGDAVGGPYYTMELAGGGNLAARLQTGPLLFREAAELVRAVATAVAAAHAKNVLHRDLKPSNVLLAADGSPKVGDFGLARLLDDPDDRLTSMDAVLGTPAYMAPEQAAGQAAEVDKPADVWALGAILYECLTGRPPYLGKTKLETLRQASEANPVPPSALRPDLPPDLEAVCLKAMSRDPARRYGSAQALADDLARWLAADPREPTVARPVGRFGRLAAVVRRRSRAAGVGLLVLGLACGFGWAFSRPKVPEPDRASRDNPRAALLIESRLLARKGPVELIGQTGRPKWYRWQNGTGRGWVADEPDGTFTVSHPGVGWLDLLTDPTTDRFRLRAQVRHDRSEPQGEVGVFVGHTIHPTPSGDVHFGIQVAFQAVSIGMGSVPTPNGLHPATAGSRVCPRFLVSEGSPHQEARCGGVAGPEVEPLGEQNGRWFDLELVVTPDGVTARFEGEPMKLTREHIDRSVERFLADVRKDEQGRDPAVPSVRPVFVPQAGVGLLVQRGSAAFRNVSIEPLPPGP